MRTCALLVVACVVLASGCGDDDVSAPVPSTRTAPSSTAPTSGISPTTTVSPPVTTGPPTFTSRIDPVTADDLGSSWREGCPVGVEDLRRLTLSHVDSDGAVAEGELIVHVDHVDDLIEVFAALFAARFPIASMRPVTAFDADDDRSMAADNTSAFNCREIAGRPGVWSEHAHGGAVDINPLVNPYVADGVVLPPAGAAYLDRSIDTPGLIRAGGVVNEAFAAIGWTWGGDWSTAKDYQHFSAAGR